MHIVKYKGRTPVGNVSIKVIKPLFGERRIFLDSEEVKPLEIACIIKRYKEWMPVENHLPFDPHILLNGWYVFFYPDYIRVGCKRFYGNDINLIKSLLKIQ